MKKKLCVMFSGNYSTRNLKLFKVSGFVLLLVMIFSTQIFAEDSDASIKNQTITNSDREIESNNGTNLIADWIIRRKPCHVFR